MRAPDASLVRETAARIRHAVRKNRTAPSRIAASLGRLFHLWRDRDFGARRKTISALAASSGFAPQLLEESVDALLAPFDDAALASLATRVRPRREVFGFVMPGNMPGAGLHELCGVLLAGAGALVKTASEEPLFFSRFIATIRETDPELGERAAAFTWSREENEITTAFRRCTDFLVVFGDDRTLAAFGADARLVGFGSRLSGALVAGADATAREVAAGLARDITLFEQRGCLSPHHVFVAAGADAARRFAARLAGALAELAGRMPAPARLGLGQAVALRRAREEARWRRMGGEQVELFEGPGLAWAVIYDPGAVFKASPGYRTVHVSRVRDAGDFARRLKPAAGRLEAFALEASKPKRPVFEQVLVKHGVSYLCRAGRMQSAPLDWPHGGGAMLKLLLQSP